MTDADGTLVDSSVLLDIVTEDPTWLGWSTDALAAAAEAGPLYVNPVVYAEVSVRFTRVEDLEDALPASGLPAGGSAVGCRVPRGEGVRRLPTRRGHGVGPAARTSSSVRTPRLSASTCSPVTRADAGATSRPSG